MELAQVTVALLDADLEPVVVSLDPMLLRFVANQMAVELEAKLPAPRTARYAAARARWMTVRQIAGLDPAADPQDPMSAWKALTDVAELPDEGNPA